MLVVVVLLAFMVFLVMAFFVVFLVVFLVVHLTNSSVPFNIVPTYAHIDIELRYAEARKRAYCGLGGLNWLHERFLTKYRDFLRYSVYHDAPRLLVATQV